MVLDFSILHHQQFEISLTVLWTLLSDTWINILKNGARRTSDFGIHSLRRAETNSIFDMAQFADAQLVSMLDQISVAHGHHGISPRSHPQVSIDKYAPKMLGSPNN